MLDIQKYLASGIIENYCLGIAAPDEARQLEAYVDQYPEIKKELEAAQDALLASLEPYRKEAPQDAEQRILNAISNYQLESLQLSPDTGMLPEFVGISPDSDLGHWKTLTKNMSPPRDFEIHVQPLFESADRQLFVVWFKDELPDEVHDDLLESVLVLEGTCIGQLDEEEHHLGPGDYFKVPLHAHHTLKVTSPEPIKLILSRVAVA